MTEFSLLKRTATQGVVLLVLNLVFLLAVTRSVESNACDDHKPCLERGGCYFIQEKVRHTFFSTKCVCARGYSGRWCQYQEEQGDDGDLEGTQNQDTPVSPRILTDLTVDVFNHSFTVVWENPGVSTNFSVLYFSIRYRKVGNAKWKDADEIQAEKTQTTYSQVLRWLDWNTRYELEIYAGNLVGISKPAKGIINRPKISYPEIIQVSEDKTGAEAILEHTKFNLFCKAHGNPSPIISWEIQGKTLVDSSNMRAENDTITVWNATVNNHQGYYRCFAKNAFGTVMSRLIQVKVYLRDRFFDDKNQENATIIFKQLRRHRAILQCPPHVLTHADTSYSWGNRDNEDPSRNFDIEISGRVWVTSKGWLVFNYFHKKDAEFVNGKGGIRCILNRTTNVGHVVTMSNLFYLEFSDDSSHLKKESTHGQFVEKPPPSIVLDYGDPLHIRCSGTFNTREKPVVKWSFHSDLKNPEITINSAKISDFGRALAVDNVSIKNELRIICEVHGPNSSLIKSLTKVKVLPRPVIQNRLPREISAYKGSNIIIKLHPNAWPVVLWYFNGRCVRKFSKTSSIYAHEFRLPLLSMEDSGIYQIDISVAGYGVVTLTTYLHVFDDDNSGIIKAPAGVNTMLNIVPPDTVGDLNLYYWIKSSSGNSEKEVLTKTGVILPSEITKRNFVFEGVAYGHWYRVTRLITFVATSPTVNGGWSSWTAWSICPEPKETCGEAFRFRKRECDNPTPSMDGDYCSGHGRERQPCAFVPCPKKVYGIWSHWTMWSDCSKTCGSGTRTRHRICSNPLSRKGKCHGNANDTQSCRETLCPVDGKWSRWSRWSECSRSCGRGIRIRQRECKNFVAGGKPCHGRKKEGRQCVDIPCRLKELRLPKRKIVITKDSNPFIDTVLWPPYLVAILSGIVLCSVGFGLSLKRCKRKPPKKYQYQKLAAKDTFDIERQPLIGNGKQKPPPAKKRLPTRKHLQGLASGTPFDFAEPAPVEPKQSKSRKESQSSKSRKLSKSKEPPTDSGLTPLSSTAPVSGPPPPIPPPPPPCNK